MTKSTDRPHLVKMSKLAKLAGVPAPTIKHYIREGLLPGPAQRTSRNMAYYDARIAERVRAIKELQQRNFLPLRLIGEILEPAPSAQIRKDLDDATRIQLGALADGIRTGHAAMVERRSTKKKKKLNREEVLSTLQITEEDLEMLTELGVLPPPTEAQNEQELSDAVLDLLGVIDDTRRAGLGDLFPMEILTPYVASVRNLVRVELNLFRQRVLESGLSDRLTVEQIATAAADLGERLLLSIRSQLLITETGALAQPWTAAPPEKTSDVLEESATWVDSIDFNGQDDDEDSESIEIEPGDSAVIDVRERGRGGGEKAG